MERHYEIPIQRKGVPRHADSSWFFKKAGFAKRMR